MVDIRHEPGPGMKQLEILVQGMQGLEGKAGFPASAVYEDGTPIAYIATIQELGDPESGIPPRSFVRTTVTEKSETWKGIMSRGAKAIIAGSADPMTVMEKLASTAAGDMRKKITQIVAPPLKEATILARLRRRASYQNMKLGGKGRANARAKVRAQIAGGLTGAIAKPLVDSGDMLAALTYEVHKT